MREGALDGVAVMATHTDFYKRFPVYKQTFCVLLWVCDNMQKGVARIGKHTLRRYSGADDFLYGHERKNHADEVPVS